MEILKRHYKPLYQVTRIAYQNVEENWIPIVEGLDDIVVKRQIPAIHILTSLDPIDPTTLGYQCNTDPRPFPNRQDSSEDENSNQPFDLHERRNPRPKNKPRKCDQEQEKEESKKHLPKKKKRNKPKEEPSDRHQQQQRPSTQVQQPIPTGSADSQDMS